MNMNNVSIVRSRGVRILLVADLIFSIVVGLIILSLPSLIYNSAIIAKIVGKFLLPLMILAPIFLIWNIVAMKKSDSRDRSKLIGYTTISAVGTLLAILAVFAAYSFTD